MIPLEITVFLIAGTGSALSVFRGLRIEDTFNDSGLIVELNGLGASDRLSATI